MLDSALFHTFHVEELAEDERPRYVASLASVTESGASLYVLCFSDQGSDTGPHPVRREELTAAFKPASGWNVLSIEPDRLQTRFHPNGHRLGSPPSNGSSRNGTTSLSAKKCFPLF